MKDKTHAMNSGNGAGVPDKGYERISSSEVPQRRAYKKAQLQDAGLFDNEGRLNVEEEWGIESDDNRGGFLPRNNTSDRF